MKRLKPAVCYKTNRCAFHLLWTELTEVIFSIRKVTLQQFREPFQRDTRQKKSDNPKENHINVDPQWGSFTKTIQEFLSNDDVLSRIRSDFFRTGAFYEKLLLDSKHFCRVATYFRTLISSQQLFFQKSYLFGAKLLPTSYFLRIDSSLGQLVFQNNYYVGKQICSEYRYL